MAAEPSPGVALDIDAVVLDIEGTTTPIEFVHTTLFGFVRAQLTSFLAGHAGDPEVAATLALLAEELAAESDRSRPAVPDESWVRWLMQRDRKSTGLKALQGLIWRDGYRDGALRSVIYADVAPALQRWHRAGITISIYSSGSIEAQRMLFARSDQGDLTPWIDHYFDTTTGPKRDVTSYVRIATTLDRPAARIGFVSDVVEELEAGAGAGLHGVLSIRPGNPPVAAAQATRFPSIRHFDELLLRR